MVCTYSYYSNYSQGGGSRLSGARLDGYTHTTITLVGDIIVISIRKTFLQNLYNEDLGYLIIVMGI